MNLLDDLQYCIWNFCPPEKAWFSLFLIGVIIGIPIGVIFFLKTNKSGIDTWKSAWSLCMASFQNPSTICKKHYDYWHQTYLSKRPSRHGVEQ